MRIDLAAFPLACALAMALVAAPVAGQQSAAAKGEPSANRIIVISDLSADETENARLRASLYDSARGRGYEPVIGVDAVGTADKQGFVRAGTVTTDEHELDSLRRALGADVLVRISKTTDGAHVTVVTGQGANSRDVQAGAVEPTVGEFIGRAPGAAASAAASMKASGGTTGAGATAGTTTEGGIVAGGLVLPDHPSRPASSDELTQAWRARGGARLTYGVRGMVTVQRIKNVPVADRPCSRSSCRTERGGENADGIGGGVGGQVGLMYLPLPEDPTLSQGIIPALRLGVGFDTNFLWVRNPIGYVWSPANNSGERHVEYADQALWVANLIPHVGFHLGFGNYYDLNTWRGAFVGLAWAPAEQFQLDMAKKPDTGEFRFNWAGFELSADLVTIKTENDADTQIRFAAYVLFPIDDDHPGLLSLSIGAFWY